MNVAKYCGFSAKDISSSLYLIFTTLWTRVKKNNLLTSFVLQRRFIFETNKKIGGKHKTELFHPN
jgi:hypothetical protein